MEVNYLMFLLYLTSFRPDILLIYSKYKIGVSTMPKHRMEDMQGKQM
jgi:hypothetical protein